jgi:RNA polymerase sigma-70 factor (ECF subfamily)
MCEADLRRELTELHAASFAWAMVCCRDREQAEEVLQSVYVKVLDGRAPYQGRSSIQTWLFAVIRNAATDHRRKQWWSRVLRLEFEALAELAG